MAYLMFLEENDWIHFTRSLKVNWSLIMTPKFLATFDVARDKDSVWMQMLWCMVCLAGKTSSSVFERFSWRWWAFIHVDMSERQSEFRAETMWSSGGNDRAGYHQHCSGIRSHVIGLSSPVKWCIWQTEEGPVMSLGGPLWWGVALQKCDQDRICWMTYQWGTIQTRSVLSLWCPCQRVWTKVYCGWLCQMQPISPAG